MYIVRERLNRQQIEQPTCASIPLHMLLRPLDTDGPLVRFSAHDTEQIDRALGGERFEIIVETLGKWNEPPTHAVYAEWRVEEEANEPKYIDSRRRLFELRKAVLPTFAYDWLLKSLDRSRVFMVLGLYGDRVGATELCRTHPQINAFIEAHPPAELGATDITGLCCFSVLYHDVDLPFKG